MMKKLPKLKDRIKNLLQVGIGPISILLTVIVTISLGILNNEILSNKIFEYDKDIPKLVDTGFYISLSIVILQILLQNYFLRKDTTSLINMLDKMNEKMQYKEYIYFPEKKFQIKASIEKMIEEEKAFSMKIICYGTGRYGGVLDTITQHKEIDVELILCSPGAEGLKIEKDRDYLKSVIKALVEYKNIHIYLSKIPPTIRASVLYDENKNPIWGSIQPYYIFIKDNERLFQGDSFTPAIVADTSDGGMLKALVQKCFDKEFERLKKSCGDKELTKKIFDLKCNTEKW